jgi:hypothetical protein
MATVMSAYPAIADVTDHSACSTAGKIAEAASGIPSNLLVSIGIVESGRSDPATGRAAPWPWTVNADGSGHYFSNKADAISYVEEREASGSRDIDIGCFQISLESHPNAFANLDDAFDPSANATFAAAFLTELKSQVGSWDTAVADYHSATPEFGIPYQRSVMAAMRNTGVSLPGSLLEGSENGATGSPESDPYVVIQTSEAKSIHIYAGSAPDDVKVPSIKTANLEYESSGNLPVVHDGLPP